MPANGLESLIVPVQIDASLRITVASGAMHILWRPFSVPLMMVPLPATYLDSTVSSSRVSPRSFGAAFGSALASFICCFGEASPADSSSSSSTSGSLPFQLTSAVNWDWYRLMPSVEFPINTSLVVLLLCIPLDSSTSSDAPFWEPKNLK